MGQYYDILNLDKKEHLYFDDLNCAKLWDYYNSFEYDCALKNLFSGRWNGDNVILLGDYCDNAEADSFVYNIIQKIRIEYSYNGIMQDYPEDFTDITYDRRDKGFRFVYNHHTKQYIDYDRIWNSLCKPTIYHLVLLLAVGNGYGMGDYDRYNDQFVGCWALTSHYIEVSRELLIIDGYSEFIPDFH